MLKISRKHPEFLFIYLFFQIITIYLYLFIYLSFSYMENEELLTFKSNKNEGILRIIERTGNNDNKIVNEQ